MARVARVVVQGWPHHVIQRGNRRLPVFFSDEDRRAYLRLLREHSQRFGVAIWAYCLMDNHVHFIAVPQRAESLALAFGHSHRHYTRMVNFREGWRGFLWQGRFASFVLDEHYLHAAVRYVEANPVRAGLVKRAEDYPWSSARAHVYGYSDDLLEPFFLLNEIRDWSAYLREIPPTRDKPLFFRHINTGRPLCTAESLQRLETITGRRLHKRKPGPCSGDTILNSPGMV